MTEVIVSREAIKADILAGYSKRPTDKAFNPEVGSIMEKYDLNEKQLRLIFQDPEIKATKYKKPKIISTVLFEEDLTEEVFKKLMKNQREFRKQKEEKVEKEELVEDIVTGFAPF